jgi:TonB-linked SusC/RagA family outer membrane protein
MSDETPELDAGSSGAQFNNGTSSQWAIASLFGRLNYNFSNKYLFEANIRYDGTSRLAPENRWGIFPSFSAGWVLSEEQFMKAMNTWLTHLKIRASWGFLGNQSIGTYPYQAMLSYTGSYPFNGSSMSTGVAQTSLNNRNLVWEKTTTADLGVDLRIIDKLSFSADAYKKYTSDILRAAQTNALVGLGAPTVNSGEMQNVGIDLELRYNDYIKSGSFKDFKWNAGLIFGSFKNKLVKFGTREIAGDVNTGTVIRQEGLVWNAFYLLQAEGIFQSAEEVASSPKQFGEKTQPGMLKFKDANLDGKIDNNDRVPIEKGVFPDFTYGFNVSAEWKGFDAYALFQGVQGSKMYYSLWLMKPFMQGTAPTKEQLKESWTPDNQSTTMVMLGDPLSFTHPSTYQLFDNSYLRLKAIQIGYSMPQKWINRIGLERLRFYFAGDNLLTFAKTLSGLDPEKSQGATLKSWSTIYYPNNKVVSFGINLTF